MALANPLVHPESNTIGSLLTGFSRRTTIDFNRMGILRRLANDRSDEVSSAYQVVIQDPTYGATVISDPTDLGSEDDYQRDAARNWPTQDAQPSAKQIIMEVKRVIDGYFNLPYLDAIEAPVPYMNESELSYLRSSRRRIPVGV